MQLFIKGKSEVFKFMKTGKQIGLVIIIVFSISALWSMFMLTYAFIIGHKLFKFDYIVSLLSTLAWVLTVVWGSVAGVNITKKIQENSGVAKQ